MSCSANGSTGVAPGAVASVPFRITITSGLQPTPVAGGLPLPIDWAEIPSVSVGLPLAGRRRRDRPRNHNQSRYEHEQQSLRSHPNHLPRGQSPIRETTTHFSSTAALSAARTPDVKRG
jgi:hypothetical protein